ncbi:MAG: hypothetical protein PHI72_00335 [Atribacterota bacterium]|jgi:protein-tyrosine phosphatase|nr:hypothetical protein [Atribacterota bacterium]MDD4895511.1 hypothetical protein [Atribacterota bacterium]MDD5636331.1 hypothetical protein [Atribacterota bacterium]
MRKKLEKKNILFVCTGNTCRSVIAQVLFQKLKEDLYPELGYQAESAGIAANNGVSPSKEAVFSLAKQGIDITTHQAKIVDSKLIKKSSLILAMTHQQLNYLQEHFPWAKNRMHLFRLFCHQKKCMKNDEIEDPYGRGIVLYDEIYKRLKQDIMLLFSYLRKEFKDE